MIDLYRVARKYKIRILLIPVILIILCIFIWNSNVVFSQENPENKECKCPSGQKVKDSECVLKTEDEVCFALYDPVCGCDGITYSNSCVAGLKGIKKFSPGECQNPQIENGSQSSSSSGGQVENDLNENKPSISLFCSSETKVRTPNIDKLISHIEKGDLILTDNNEIAKVTKVIKKKTKGYKVYRLTFNDGVILEVNSKHDNLKIADFIDGRMIVDVKLVPYSYKYTYSILSDSKTGNYYANGILIGSTLKK